MSQKPAATPDAPAVRMRDLLARVAEKPWAFGFTTLMRAFGARHARSPAIGLASRPRQEAFRLGQAAALDFSPREIASVIHGSDGESPAPGIRPVLAGNNAALPMIRLYGLGMLGPNGPLPLHVTELVRERTEHFNDSTLSDFLDVFHHRYLTHMHRAWAQSQATAGLDRRSDETFSRYIARLTGHDPDEIRDSVLPDHARMSASTHLSREARNPDGLVQTLAQFFAVQVQLKEYVRHWIPIDNEDQTRLAMPRRSSILGRGAVAGEMIADRQNRFRLVLGPLELATYARFTPRGQDLPKLVEWVRGFVGHEFMWELELRIFNASTPAARLEDRERLGWSTWLGGSGVTPAGAAEVTGDACASSPTTNDRQDAEKTRVPWQRMQDYTVGMVFEPELAIGQVPHPIHLTHLTRLTQLTQEAIKSTLAHPA
ncbi:MAG: type VI secretion system baseplate subunit TssG [Comamonadaceae bacterium]|nr:MAG: type VI secretion system baseplate subunit TssG [Comamonadaceae bacterium]